MDINGGTTNDHEGRLHSFFWTGVVLQVIGGVIVGVAWPGEETTGSTFIYDNTETVDTGSVAGVAAGAIVAWVGLVLIMIGVIGWGVKFGMLAFEQRKSAPAGSEPRGQAPQASHMDEDGL